ATKLRPGWVDYHQTPEAPAAARRGRMEEGLTVKSEEGPPADVIEELHRRGHQIGIADRTATEFGRAQLIYCMEDGYLGASERRTDGQAGGVLLRAWMHTAR